MNLIKHFLFEDPLALWLAMGIIAVVAAVWWSRTGSRRAVATVVGCVAAGVLVGLAAWLVETDHEKLIRTLDVMARAAAAGNAEAFIERISPEYGADPLRSVPTVNKDSLAKVVRLGLQQVRVAAEEPVPVESPGRATVTQVYVFTPAPGSHMPIAPGGETVTWEGEFAPDADGEWRLRSARAIKPVRMTPEEALQYLRAAASAVGM